MIINQKINIMKKKEAEIKSVIGKEKKKGIEIKIIILIMDILDILEIDIGIGIMIEIEIEIIEVKNIQNIEIPNQDIVHLQREKKVVQVHLLFLIQILLTIILNLQNQEVIQVKKRLQFPIIKIFHKVQYQYIQISKIKLEKEFLCRL